MKIKAIQQIGAAFVLGLAFCLPTDVRADSDVIWQNISRFEPVKSNHTAKALAVGDTVAKVCTACKAVTLKRVVSVNQGQVILSDEKCEYCGSGKTYFATLKMDMPAKDGTKH